MTLASGVTLRLGNYTWTNIYVDGRLEADGAAVELLYASRLDLKPCTCGTMHCWNRTPGQCCFQDDMQGVLARLKEAETLILATPAYSPLPGAMQNFLNRLCPLLDPVLENRQGRTRARFREDVRIRRIALVSTSGWWEWENMGTVVRIAEELARDAGVEFCGALLRPHAYLMKSKGEVTEGGATVLQAARTAGSELVKEGGMSAATLEAVRRPLICEEELRRRYNEEA